MNAKTMIKIGVGAGVILFFLLIVANVAFAMNTGLVRYSTVNQALITGNFEDITDPTEKEFYLKVKEISDEIKASKKVNIDVALFVATFITIEGVDNNFSYDIVTFDMIRNLLNSNYEAQVTLFCSTIVNSNTNSTGNDKEEVSTITKNCSANETCTCPEGYTEQGEKTVYTVSNNKYKQYLKDTFLISVLSDGILAGDETERDNELDEIIEIIFQQYNELLRDIVNETTDLSLFTMPVSADSYCTITSPYGGRIDPISKKPRFHYGIDIVTAYPRSIYASGNGVVSAARTNVKYADPSQGYGNVLFITHNINGMKYETVYAHLLYGSITVNVGDQVVAGQQIATMGTTGYSTGIHLHFEIRLNGERVDPSGIFLGNCISNRLAK